MSEKKISILVDADACPQDAKEILYRTSRRLELRLTLVANQNMRIPIDPLVTIIVVEEGPDVADDKIVELTSKYDLIVTNDILLAERVVKLGAIAIGTRGELYDEDTVHEKVASRNLMEQLRSAGMETGGPKPQNKKHLQVFANQLDKIITRNMKKVQLA